MEFLLLMDFEHGDASYLNGKSLFPQMYVACIHFDAA